MDSRPVLRLACWSCFLALAVLDAVVSARLSLGMLYLVPLALAALRLGAWDVGVLVVASALAHGLFGAAGDALGLMPAGTRLTLPPPLEALVTGLLASTVYAAVALVLVRLREQQRRLVVLGQEVERDPLTGLGNRRALSRFFREQGGRQAALLLLDVDYFKQVNDTHGHAAGDQVLRELAGRLAGMVRAQDRVVRAGGEEFVLLLPGADIVTAREVAGRLLEAVRGEPFRLETGERVPVTASIGLVAGPACDALLHSADRALYLAKGQGRNRVEEALSPPRTAVLRAGDAG